MITIAIIFSLFFGGFAYQMVHYKDRISCEQFVQNIKDGKHNTNYDKGQHFYHGHGKANNYEGEKP